MVQFAQSEFFYHHIAPNLMLVKAVFFLGIFGLVGVVAQSVRIGLEAEEAEDRGNE
ncbi:MAG: hypothetical protein LUC51_11600 [Cloacibacillus porcorum]|nr:hypothetical protein [Cloacibacillus porcorum]